MISDINRSKIISTNRNYLVYTSAGDQANISQWIQGTRNFDLWITYYGDQPNRFRCLSEYYNKRKGGKFPNLHYVYQNDKSILEQYEAILVMDDDIIIETEDINRLFAIREEYDLWLLQPAFDPKGKVSHLITCFNPLAKLRYTNFVELGCPLFRKDKLDNFMSVYDPTLVGWGIDLWVMNTLGPELIGKVAVIDLITCTNPHDQEKNGERSIDQLQSLSDRKNIWCQIKERYGLPESEVFIQFAAIKNPLQTRLIFQYLLTRIRFGFQKLQRWLSRQMN